MERTGESEQRGGEHAAIFTTATTFDAPRNVFVVNIQEPPRHRLLRQNGEGLAVPFERFERTLLLRSSKKCEADASDSSPSTPALGWK